MRLCEGTARLTRSEACRVALRVAVDRQARRALRAELQAPDWSPRWSRPERCAQQAHEIYLNHDAVGCDLDGVLFCLGEGNREPKFTLPLEGAMLCKEPCEHVDPQVSTPLPPENCGDAQIWAEPSRTCSSTMFDLLKGWRHFPGPVCFGNRYGTCGMRESRSGGFAVTGKGGEIFGGDG